MFAAHRSVQKHMAAHNCVQAVMGSMVRVSSIQPMQPAEQLPQLWIPGMALLGLLTTDCPTAALACATNNGWQLIKAGAILLAPSSQPLPSLVSPVISLSPAVAATWNPIYWLHREGKARAEGMYA